MSCDTDSQTAHLDENLESLEMENWSSDCSNSDEEEHANNVGIFFDKFIFH